ncbi:MAG: hypothetical protein ACOYK8_09990 [Alphaproteobacteria bacterium]
MFLSKKFNRTTSILSGVVVAQLMVVLQHTLMQQQLQQLPAGDPGGYLAAAQQYRAQRDQLIVNKKPNELKKIDIAIADKMSLDFLRKPAKDFFNNDFHATIIKEYIGDNYSYYVTDENPINNHSAIISRSVSSTFPIHDNFRQPDGLRLKQFFINSMGNNSLSAQATNWNNKEIPLLLTAGIISRRETGELSYAHDFSPPDAMPAIYAADFVPIGTAVNVGKSGHGTSLATPEIATFVTQLRAAHPDIAPPIIYQAILLTRTTWQEAGIDNIPQEANGGIINPNAADELLNIIKQNGWANTPYAEHHADMLEKIPLNNGIGWKIPLADIAPTSVIFDYQANNNQLAFDIDVQVYAKTDDVTQAKPLETIGLRRHKNFKDFNINFNTAAVVRFDALSSQFREHWQEQDVQLIAVVRLLDPNQKGDVTLSNSHVYGFAASSPLGKLNPWNIIKLDPHQLGKELKYNQYLTQIRSLSADLQHKKIQYNAAAIQKLHDERINLTYHRPFNTLYHLLLTIMGAAAGCTGHEIARQTASSTASKQKKPKFSP